MRKLSNVCRITSLLWYKSQFFSLRQSTAYLFSPHPSWKQKYRDTHRTRRAWTGTQGSTIRKSKLAWRNGSEPRTVDYGPLPLPPTENSGLDMHFLASILWYVKLEELNHTLFKTQLWSVNSWFQLICTALRSLSNTFSFCYCRRSALYRMDIAPRVIYWTRINLPRKRGQAKGANLFLCIQLFAIICQALQG